MYLCVVAPNRQFCTTFPRNGANNFEQIRKTSYRSTDSVTVMIVGFGYIQCARGLYPGDDLEEILILQDFFLVIILPKVKNSAKGRVKVYHGIC